MEDGKVLQHIKDLITEEDKLYAATDINSGEIARLHKIKIELDQYWDFMRQRRALRDAGKNPDDAHIRRDDVVENYEQ